MLAALNSALKNALTSGLKKGWLVTEGGALFSESRYRKRTDELKAAAVELQALLEELVKGCDAALLELDAGMSALDVVRAASDSNAGRLRRDVATSAGRFNHALQATRGEAYRILMVDGNGTWTDVARMAGISTQMVKRLVNSVQRD